MSNKLRNRKQEISCKKQGYTLIEVLASIGIFSIAVAISTSFFVSSLKNQSRALSIRETIDNASHVIEYVSRALRMAKKDLSGQCLSAYDNYDNLGADDSKVRFLSYNSIEDKHICREFYLSGDRLKERKSNDETATFITDLYLTSDDLKINKARFKLLGETQLNDQQPRVTILFEMVKDDDFNSSKIIIQTTVSQRNLDILQ